MRRPPRLRHAPAVGWARELSAEQQEAVGVRLAYLHRVDPFDRSRLLTSPLYPWNTVAEGPGADQGAYGNVPKVLGARLYV